MQRHYQHGGASSQPPVHPFQGVAPPRPPEAPLPTDAVDGTRTRSVELFNKEKIIGEGTYGEVWLAHVKRQPHKYVALKKVKLQRDTEKEGFPITAIREIKILKSLKHKNIVNLEEIVVGKAHGENNNRGSIYMVFEYLEHDLTGLTDFRPAIKFTLAQIKCYVQQILEGLEYCHRRNILHRDIKGSNVLIGRDGRVKLADFGLARHFAGVGEHEHPLTNRVITLWYRPPELLLGETKYGPEVDMWSVGCILAELVLGKPLLPGKAELEQLELIFRLCGPPTADAWPGFEQLPFSGNVQRTSANYRKNGRLAEVLKGQAPETVELVARLLALNPRGRISAPEALAHRFFTCDPRPCEPGAPESFPPVNEPSHEYETKKRRQQQRLGVGPGAPGAQPPGGEPPAKRYAGDPAQGGWPGPPGTSGGPPGPWQQQHGGPPGGGYGGYPQHGGGDPGGYYGGGGPQPQHYGHQPPAALAAHGGGYGAHPPGFLPPPPHQQGGPGHFAPHGHAFHGGADAGRGGGGGSLNWVSGPAPLRGGGGHHQGGPDGGGYIRSGGGPPPPGRGDHGYNFRENPDRYGGGSGGGGGGSTSRGTDRGDRRGR